MNIERDILVRSFHFLIDNTPLTIRSVLQLRMFSNWFLSLTLLMEVRDDESLNAFPVFPLFNIEGVILCLNLNLFVKFPLAVNNSRPLSHYSEYVLVIAVSSISY